MPTYQIQAPDGKTYEIDGPSGASQTDVINAVLSLNPTAGQAPTPPKEGIMAALTGGAKRFGSTLETGLESLIDPTLAAQRGAARGEEISRQYAPGASLEKVKQAYEQKGLFPAAYEAISQIPSALAEQAPNIAASLGGARVGAMAGSPFGPVGAVVGGVGGAFAPSLMQLYGSNLQRQAEEKVPEISRAKALGTAVPGAAAGVASTFIPLGRNLIGKLLGPQAEKALARGTNEGIEAAAKEGIATSLAKGAGVGALVEIPTEVGQQMLERLQAGLPLTTPDALAEYGEAVYGAVLVGAPFGATARGLGRPAARAEYENMLQTEQAKEDAELDKRAAQAAKEQKEQIQKTQSQLGVPVTGENVSNVLMLPAPGKKYEEPKDLLNDPVGRITEDELGKAIGDSTVVNYLNKYRRDNNLPKLKSYSVEDIKDAMTAQNPEGEEGALNSILAYKTGYKDETYTVDDINNVAVAKNVATETKGFSDFLTRATGKSDLNTMTQPQLHSVYQALNALPREGKEQQLVLPEGSNATRFTQDQYNQGVTTALMGVKQGKPVSLDQARNAVKAQTDLKTDRDADQVLKTAASNEDLIIERGTGFQAANKTGEVLGTYGTEAEARRNHRRADITPVETQLVRAPEEIKTDKTAKLPEGYGIEKTAEVGESGPAAYVVRVDGSQKNESQTFAEEVDAKDRLNALTRGREANAKAKEASADRIRQDLEREQTKIVQMESDGLTGTAEHTKAVNAFKAANVAKSAQITSFLDEAEAFRAPLKIVPLGKKTAKVEKHTVTKGGKKLGTFPNKTEAEKSILSQADEQELQTIADRGGAFGKRAEVELGERKRTTPGIKVKGTTEGLEKAGVHTPEVEAQLQELKAKLIPMLKKFGLEQVGLNVVRAIENDADGAWGKADKLIRIALQATKPIQTMRHEALHALKELGFFTPQQWEALKRQADKTWVNKYLKGQMVEVNGKRMTRYDAYANGVKNDDGTWALKPLSPEDILEEAIADAFGSWEGGQKPPPGLMAALFKRMQQFFTALRQALTGAGFESAEDIFGKIEGGKLKAGKEAAGVESKLSLPAEEKPEKKIDPNDVSRVVIDGSYADSAIRTMNSQIMQTSKPLEVDDVGRLFDKAFLDEFKRKGDWKSPADFQRAVSQAVTELKHQLQQTKSGLDWYEEDIAEAFKQTQKYIPSLKKPEKRALFSVIAGIMSPSVNARDNWVIAAQAYQYYEKTGILPGSNPATGSLWQGGLESANKKKQLDMLNNMLQPKSKGGLGEKGTVEWLQGDHTVAEITNFRKKYGGMGKSSTGGKASDILPGFTAFGPKVGPFVMNINGIHDVTVDVWMTRTFNRYFGQMMGADGTMTRAPTEPQRVAIKKLAMDAAAQVGIKPYQVQSTLWFFEQQLFNKLGTGAKSYGFSDGAIRFIESQGGAASAKGAPANVGANAPTDKPAGKQNVGTSAQAARPSTGQQGVSGGQKYSLGKNADRISFVGPAYDERKLRGAGDRGRGSEVRNLAPLEGSPSVEGFSGPDPRLVSIAEQYAKDSGLTYSRQKEYVQVDEDRARRIADAYDKMPHAPQDPEVKEAYQNLIRQTRAQYDALVKNGYKFWFTDYNIPDNAEYLSSPWNAMRDIRANKTMGVFPTNEGFGTTDFDPAANPLLEDTGLEWPVGGPNNTRKSPVLANDLFRAVHDAFGHGLEGAGFRARGEENAWLAHSKLFTGSALAAITSETRGQNSWLNYGPQGKKNRTAKIEDTTFADQKTGLMPSWTWQEGQEKYSLKFSEPALRPKQGEGIVLGDKQPDAQSFVGLHYGQNKVDELSGSKYGTGIRGAERRRLDDTDDKRIKKRIYFYIPKKDGSMPRNEAGLGGHVYTQQFDNIAAGLVVDRLFSKANGDANQFESSVVDAGYDGYAMPSMGMMVTLNHNTPVEYHGTMGELAESGKKFSLRTAPDTKEFKQWFGGSKVVDANGKPQMVFHTGNFNANEIISGAELNRRQGDKKVPNNEGIYFSANAIYSSMYGRNRPGITMYPVYLSLQNPLVIKNMQQMSRLEKLKHFVFGKRKVFENASGFGDMDSMYITPEYKAELIEQGYDGIINEPYTEIVAFESTQIKSAIGNRGTYDANDPDIRYSLNTYFPTAEEAENAAYKKAPPGTAEFKRFFGGSRVMEEGRPLPMYHGSLNDFSQFNEDNRKGLIFVTPSPAFAEEYALLHASRMEKQAEPPVKVYPLWVRAETPFDYENSDHVARVMESLGGSMGVNEYIQTEKEVKQGNWAKIEDPRFVATLKKLGFDSLYVMENKTKNLAVFTASQVKSITGNIGEFSLETKDMRFSLKKVRYSDDRFEKLWNDSMYTQNDAENKTIGYLAFVNPIEFVRATASPEAFERLRKEQEPIDFAKMKSYDLVPFLEVTEKDGDWKITGHEGRHRMLALHNAGYSEIPVYIHLRANNAESIPTKMMKAQYDDAMSSFLMAAEVEPLSYANKNKAMEKFTRMDSKVKFSLKPVSADIDAAIDRTTTAREDKGFIGRILEAIFPQSAGHFRQQALNRYNQLGVYDRMLADKMGGAAMLADQSAESAALMSDLNASVTASAFGYGNRTGGVPTYRNGITTIDTSVKGPIAILASLAKYNNPRIYQRYQFWAGVKRGKRFMADGKEKNFEQADIARAAQLEKDHPEFIQIQKEMNEFNNGLVKYMVQTGVIDPVRAKIYMEHADYIPFYRQMDGERTIGPNIFQSISGVKAPKALKGSEAPLADYLETIVRNTQSAIQSGMKNTAAQRAVGVAEKVGLAQRLNTQDSGPDTVQVLEKGVRVSYRVADPLFIDACRSLNLPDLPFMGLLAAPANFLRNLVTKDPGFMLANMMRDSLSSWVTSGTSVTPIIGTISGFTKALSGKSASMEALLNAGILGGYEFSSGVLKSGEVLEADMNKKYGKATGAKVLLKPFTSLWDALEKGTEASDAATRIAIYERVLADTGNEAEAIFRSLEVMNFNRKGSSAIIRIATAAIPFLNARMQGLDIFYRTSFGRDTDANAALKQKAFFVRGATLMALSIAAYIMVSDDEEYKKQEEETKDNYWIIPGVGKFPTPFEVGFLFKTVPERIYAAMFKDDTSEDLKESMKRGITSTLAFNPMPQTFKPLAEALVNYNSFTGRVIVGAGMEGRSPEFQVGPSTSEVAKQIGSSLGLSPLKVDHVLQGYTGTIGMYLVQVTDSVLNANDNSPNASKRFEQLPIIKRFAVDPEARGNITQFYALKNATDQAVTTINFLERSGDAEAYAKYFEENIGILANKGYVNSIEKQMKGYREMRAMIQSAEMTGDEKRDILIDIGRAENALNENIKEVKKAIKELQ